MRDTVLGWGAGPVSPPSSAGLGWRGTTTSCRNTLAERNCCVTLCSVINPGTVICRVTVTVVITHSARGSALKWVQPRGGSRFRNPPVGRPWPLPLLGPRGRVPTGTSPPPYPGTSPPPGTPPAPGQGSPRSARPAPPRASSRRLPHVRSLLRCGPARGPPRPAAGKGRRDPW